MAVLSHRPLQVVFLACNKNPHRFAEDGSFIYRCNNLAGALARAGHQVSLAHISRWRPTQAADAIVFHRPRLNWRLRWLLWRLRAGGHPAVRVADVDDLIFLPELAAISPGVLNGQVPLRQIHAQFAAHRAALAQFEYISASTQPLLDELAAQRLQGRRGLQWLPNAVHGSWRELPTEPPIAQATHQQLIRYLPGTRSHDRDFALIAAALQAFLRARPTWRLEVVGPLALDLDVPAQQLTHLPKQSFEHYHALVRDAWLNLAPLEDNRFTRCKSAIKVIEAGFWGVPTLCTPLPDAQRFAQAGAVLAPLEDWPLTLARLADHPTWHAQLRSNLRQRVLAHADIDVLAQRWLTDLGLAR